MTVLALFVAVILIGMTLIAISNALLLPRLRWPSVPGSTPSLSLLIPARNEESVLPDTLRSLQAQTYPFLEVFVLDDESEDGTADIVRGFARQDGRFRLVAGQPLPEGWIGKNWACHQLAELSQGEYLVFSDADVRWAPSALEAIAAALEQMRADGLAVWPTQITVTWAERLVVPLMAMSTLGYLPVLAVHHLPFDSMAAAIGQCLVFRRDVYRRIGGHAAVRDRILEDVLLVRAIKRAGLRLRWADGAGLVSCRMYRDWPSVRDGFAKNILAGHGDSVCLLALSALFHWLIFLTPWLWLAAGLVGVGPSGRPWQPAVLIALGVGIRALTAATSGQRPTDALLLPVSIMLMTAIAIRSVWQQWQHGGPQWKGRSIPRRARH